MMLSVYECHCHIALDGINYKNAAALHANGPDEWWVRSVLQQYLENGIFYLRDGGDKWGASRLAKQLAGEYEIEYATPIWPLYHKGNYGSFLGLPYETLDEYKQLVLKAKAQGADFIKIMGSGIMDFDRYGVITGFVPEQGELNELAAIAHGEGLPVMMHMNSDDGVKRAVDAGVDSIEHGNYVGREALAMMASAGTVWVPTISATQNLLGMGLFDEAALNQILTMQQDNIRLGHQLGVTIACGSDAGAGCVKHVQGSWDEAERLGKLMGAMDDVLKGQECLRARFPG